MGGADIAVARDTSALHAYGLAQSTVPWRRQQRNRLYQQHHAQDAHGNDTHNVNRFPLLGNLGYAQRLHDMPLTLGIGLFAQGGTGNEYDNLRGVHGRRPFGDARLARMSRPASPGRSTTTLALGVSLIGTYGDLEQRLSPIPRTQIRSTGPLVLRLRTDRMRDTGSGIKLGLMYPAQRLDNAGRRVQQPDRPGVRGEATVDLSALGLGRSTADARVHATSISRRSWASAPRSRPATRFAVAGLNWIDWSGAIGHPRSSPAHRTTRWRRRRCA